MNLRSILCAVDFSEGSQQALRWAVAAATRFDAALHVLSAVDPLLAEAARRRFGIDLAGGETEPALREFVNAVLPTDAARVPRVAFEVPVGHAPDVILDAASRHGSDLIVMGTQGLGGFQKVILGSTAERVLRRTRTPVLAVPAGAHSDAVVGAAGAPLDVSRILVATDFSDTAAAAVECAARLARTLGVPLTLAHVVEPLNTPAQWRAYVAEADETRVAAARARLEEVAGRVADGPAHDSIVSIGSAAETIASIADQRGAGLIVMGLTGATDPLAPRPGAIAYRVLSLARSPVLIVPLRP